MNSATNRVPAVTRLEADDGLGISLLDYGATLQSIRVPTADGAVEILLGYEDPNAYLDDPYYLGCTVGRYAGRIDSGRFELDGKRYRLDVNDPDHGHCLHGGAGGFSKQFWKADAAEDGRSVTFSLVSPDGDQGFPGQLEVKTCYSLIDRMGLQIDYRAEADADTVLNLTNHAYFNLNGHPSGIGNHEVWINAEFYLPMTGNMLPTGDIRNVKDSVFDFQRKAILEDRLAAGDRQLELAGGFDHFFMLNKAMKYPAIAASIASPESGIRLKFYSARPGVQFYTGNSLAEPFGPRTGLCLEFQNAPNAPNQSGFPSPILKAGETWHRQLIMEFESS
jgi:aldose 1-epimerase